MTELFKVTWSCQVDADNALDAAYEAHSLMQSEDPCLDVTDPTGKVIPILVVSDTLTPYYRVVGLDVFFTPVTYIVSAEDAFQAREVAKGMGLQRVMMVEKTILSELREDDIRAWLYAHSESMGKHVTVEIGSVGPETGTITLTCEQSGASVSHSFNRHSDGKDSGLIQSSEQRIQYLCADILLKNNREMSVLVDGFLVGPMIEVDVEGATIYVSGETGQVKGWKASTISGYRMACQVLIVDVIGELTMEDERPSLTDIGYWTRQGDHIQPGSKAEYVVTQDNIAIQSAILG